MKLYNVKNRVAIILRDYPETRDSDDRLISKVDETINPHVAKLPYFDVMRNRKKYGLPTCESIRRCRQKLQAEHEELRGCRKVENYRRKQLEEYQEFARN